MSHGRQHDIDTIQKQDLTPAPPCLHEWVDNDLIITLGKES